MKEVFVYGVTAVGKSTWAKEQALARGLAYIDGDKLKEWEYSPLI